MQPTFHIPSHYQFWDTTLEIIGQRSEKSYTCPQKKNLGCQLFSPKPVDGKLSATTKIGLVDNYLAKLAKQ